MMSGRDFDAFIRAALMLNFMIGLGGGLVIGLIVGLGIAALALL